CCEAGPTASAKASAVRRSFTRRWKDCTTRGRCSGHATMIVMKLAGVFAPLPTPFDTSGEVDTRRLRDAIARWAAGPLAGFIVLGSNGEAVFLDEDEADRVAAAAREAVPASRPLIIGTGRESTRAAIAATKRA